MAPLADNLTPRLFIEYTSMGHEHTMLIRLQGGATGADAITAYNEITAILKSGMHTSDSFTGARFSAAGSNLSFPLSVTAVAGTGSTSVGEDNKPNFVSWTGRSLQGRRVKITFFTGQTGEITGFRWGTPPAGWLANMLSYLDLDAEGIVAADGGIPVWNPYVNMGVNSYYQRKFRRTG